MVYFFRTTFLFLICASCTITNSMNIPERLAVEKSAQKTKQENPPEVIATTVIASGALPGPEFTDTLKKRNPISPQQGELTRDSSQHNLLGLHRTSPTQTKQ